MTHRCTIARLTGLAACLLSTAALAAPSAVDMAQTGEDPALKITEDLTT